MMLNKQDFAQVEKPQNLTKERLFRIEGALKTQDTVKGMSWGLISALIYSLSPLISYITVSSEHEYGSFVSSTMYVVWQEVFAAIIMCLCYKPTEFFRYFKKLKDPRSWLIVLIGVTAGPIAMVMLTLAAQFTIVAGGQKDDTIAGMLLNLNAILACLLSNALYKTKNSKLAYMAFFVSAGLIVGLSIHFCIEKDIQPIGVLGIIFGLVAAVLYALEAVFMYAVMNKMHLNLSDREVVSIKTGTSAILMLIFAMPIASLADHDTAVNGYKAFALMGDWVIAIKYIIGGVLMGFGRMMYYYCIKHASGSYAASSQLLMLFWTPIIQYIMVGIQKYVGDPFLLQNEQDKWGPHVSINSGILIVEPEWWYWVYAIPIVIALLVIVFDENFFQIAEKKGWKAAALFFKEQNRMSEKDQKLMDKYEQEFLMRKKKKIERKIAKMSEAKKLEFIQKRKSKEDLRKKRDLKWQESNIKAAAKWEAMNDKMHQKYLQLSQEKRDKIEARSVKKEQAEKDVYWKKVLAYNERIERHEKLKNNHANL
ncbi:DMT family transporter [Spiroplasma endosymbiont of Labia minor]|uniref:DMT family transporter n=1 Tax=Spiroplasma endosymbiont of Labia minor TaxID=3066305 RepID=UPI0030CAD45E